MDNKKLGTLDEMFPELIGTPLPLRYKLLIWWVNKIKSPIRRFFGCIVGNDDWDNDEHYQELYSDDKEIIDFPEHDPDTIYG